MTVYFDTNVVIDILEEREPFFQYSKDVFLMAAAGKIDGIIGASSITDIYYIARKSLKNSSLALNAVVDLLDTLNLIDTTKQDIYSAINSNIKDFEDAVTVATAERKGANYIITRNTKDFINSSITAITPEDFLSRR